MIKMLGGEDVLKDDHTPPAPFNMPKNDVFHVIKGREFF